MSETFTPSTETPIQAAVPVAEPIPDFTSPSLDTIDPYLDYHLEVDEHLGYLKELGLDYGWGITSSIQWALEHFHIYTGLPWGFSILGFVVSIRMLLFPLYVRSNDMSVKFRALKSQTEPFVQKIREARAGGDRGEIVRANQEMVKQRRLLGLRFRPLLVPFIQVPIGFGTFRLLRGMGSLPVPGLDTAGMLWFTDLTLKDPMFILPIATSAIYFWSFKV